MQERIAVIIVATGLAGQAQAAPATDLQTRSFTVHRQIAHGDEANIMELAVPYQLGSKVERTGSVCWQSVTRQTGEEKHARTLIEAGNRVTVEETWPVLTVTRTVVECEDPGQQTF